MTERKLEIVKLLVTIVSGFVTLVLSLREPARFNTAGMWITLPVLAFAIGVQLCSVWITEKRLRNKTYEKLQKANDTFTTRWNFCLSMLLKLDAAEDIITHLEDIYERDIKRYGPKRARLLFRKNVLVSLWPVAKWVIHRAMALEALKRLIG
ncbi:MAG: hypothetical protein ACJ746_00620 [Bryobacteraceae bacterium]